MPSTSTSSNDTNIVKVTHDELPKFIMNAAMSQRTLFIHGRTGIGKSTGIRMFAKMIGCKHVLDRRPANEDVTELAGFTIPDLENFITKHCPPSWSLIKTEEPVIVVFEEVTSTKDTTMQAMLYEVLQERTLRGRKFDDNWIFIATGNLADEDGLVFNIPAPLLNRFLHVELSNTSEGFVKYGRKNNLHPSVIAFISHNGMSELHQYTTGEKAFRTNRTWEEVSKMLYNPLLQEVLQRDFKIIETIPKEVEEDFYRRNAFVSKESLQLLRKGIDKEFVQKSIATAIGVRNASNFINFLKNSHRILPIIDKMFAKSVDFAELNKEWEELSQEEMYILIEYVASRLHAILQEGGSVDEHMQVCARLIARIATMQNNGSFGANSREFVIGFYSTLNEASKMGLIAFATANIGSDGPDSEIVRHILNCQNRLNQNAE